MLSTPWRNGPNYDKPSDTRRLQNGFRVKRMIKYWQFVRSSLFTCYLPLLPVLSNHTLATEQNTEQSVVDTKASVYQSSSHPPAKPLATPNEVIASPDKADDGENATEKSLPTASVDMLNDAADQKQTDEPTFMDRTFNRLEYSRNDWSEKINLLAKKVDRFIGQEEAEEEVYESSMRLRLSNTFKESGDNTGDVSLKVRLDLPLAKRRFRLIVENDPDDQESLGEKSLTQDKGNLGDEENKHFLAGFRYILGNDTEKWYVATDAGVRVRLRSQAFVRLKSRRNYQLSEFWHFQIRQNIYYFNEDGFGQKTQFHLQRPLTEQLTFRSTSEAKWEKEDDYFEFAQFLAVLQSINPKKAVEYKLGVLGESQPSQRVTNYSFVVNYRELIYKDWLFFEIGPGVLFDRKDNFDLTPSISFKLEIFFLSQ